MTEQTKQGILSICSILALGAAVTAMFIIAGRQISQMEQGHITYLKMTIKLEERKAAKIKQRIDKITNRVEVVP